MSLDNKNVLAVIPARGGSKGIPRKNLRKINGKSLIEYAADCISQLDWIDAAILSTDDDEICKHGKELGIDVPFMRPAELSTDHAKSIDVWTHAWLECEKYFNKRFDLSILLEPTSPMRTPEDIYRATRLLLDSKANAVATVSKTPGHFTPHKTLQLSKEGYIESYLPDGMKYTIRQHIPDYYHRNGVCYAVTRSSLIDHHALMEDNCLPLIIDRPVINIDEDIDLKLAEILLDNI